MQNKIFQGIIFGISGLISFAFLVVLCKWCHMYHARRRRAQQNSAKDYQTYQVTQAIPGKFSDRQLYGSGQCVQPGIGGDVELARELRDGTLDFEYTLEPNVPLGKVQLSILYEIEVRKLNVLLLQAKDVVCQTQRNSANLYAKVLLTKDTEGTKLTSDRCTKIQRMSPEPQFHEEFSFCVNEREIGYATIQVCLYEIDAFSKSHALGQVSIDMKDVDITQRMTGWFDLYEEEEEKRPTSGDLLLSLNYFPTAGRLTVVIMRARDLKIEHKTGAWGVFVKVMFLYNQKRVSKKKTVVVRKTENPIYNEAFVFKVPKEAMAYSSFKILVVNRTSYGRDEALGDITIGPQEYKDGLLHWNKMLMELRKPVAMWHPIIMN